MDVEFEILNEKFFTDDVEKRFMGMLETINSHSYSGQENSWLRLAATLVSAEYCGLTGDDYMFHIIHSNARAGEVIMGSAIVFFLTKHNVKFDVAVPNEIQANDIDMDIDEAANEGKELVRVLENYHALCYLLAITEGGHENDN